MDKEYKEAIKELKAEARISDKDAEVEEALRNSKIPIQRIGQGVHNGSFYYGTTLIWKGKPVSAVITSDKKIYLGLNYHHWKCANCSYSEQIIQPCYDKPRVPKSCKCQKIGDKDLQLVETTNPIKNEFGLNYLTEFNDDAIDYQWETEAIKRYRAGKYEKRTIQDIYEEIVSLNKKYIEHLNPASHQYIACWIIATYCYTLFEQFGRLYNRAEKGSGKTKQAKIIKFLSHNPIWISKGTESSIFRDEEATCGTIIIDNMDKLHEDLKRALEHYIEVGWMREATYRLTDKDKGRTMKFSAYSSLYLNNIYGLDSDTIDKTFEIPMLKSVNNNIKRAKPTCKSEDWEKLRNDLRYFVLDNWQDIQSKYAEITASFSGREFDVVEGVLAIAKLVGKDVFDAIENYVQEKISEEMVELENNPAYMIFSKIWAHFIDNPLDMEYKAFTGVLADELFLSLNPDLQAGSKEYANKKKGCSKYIANIIRQVPMFRKGGLAKGKTYITIGRKELEQYMKLQHFLNEDGHLPTSTTSTTSTQSTKPTQIKESISKDIESISKRVDVGDLGDVGRLVLQGDEIVQFGKTGIKEELENE